MSKIFEIAFKLGGELTSSFTNAINQANKSFKGLQATGEAMQSMGKTLSMTVTAPVIAIGTAAVAAAIEFESAFAGVKKTIDSTDEGYAKLEAGIREMSKSLPASASEIAAVAESAGQLGIAEANVLSFSRTIVDLGESTNMTREQAATEFARFANIVGMSQDNFDRLGSSIVGLGNTMATTESEIMSMGMRLAGQGAQVGMAESEIMALSATMSSLGIGAESGGTAMTTILKKIQTATGAGGKQLNAFAKVAGMSGNEFKKAFETDAVGALDSLVKGLAVSGAEGENLTGILKTLGIKGIYESDVLLRMSGASDLLSSALDTAGTAWKENTALSNEAEQRYATTASQLAILKNKVTDVAITIGGILLPIILEAADEVGVWIDKFAALDESTMKTIMVFAGLAAAVGPVLIVMGTLITSTVSIIRAYKSVTTAIKALNIVQRLSTTLITAYRTAMLASTFAGGGLKGMIAGLRSGLVALNLSLLANPFVLAAVGLVALGAAFYALYQKSETFRAAVDPLLTMLKGEFIAGFEQIKGAVMEVMPQVIAMVSEIIPLFINIASTIIPMLGTIFQAVLPVILAIVQGVFPVIIMLLQTVISVVLTLVQAVIPLILTVVSTVFPIVLSIIQMIIPIITTILDSLVMIIQGVVVPSINAILAVVQYVFPYIQLVITNALAIVNGLIQAAMALLQGDWDGAWNAIKGTAETIMNNIISFFSGINLFEVGKSIINGLINGIASMGSTVVTAISGLIPEPIRGAASKLLGAFSGGEKGGAVPEFALGGIVGSPTLAWVGEGGDTESIIPWNNSQRSKDLWLQTGQALGMLNGSGAMDNLQQQIAMQTYANENPPISSEQVTGTISNNQSSSNAIHVHYNPQYNVAKAGDLAEVKQHAEKDKDNLEARLAAIAHDERRTSFGD